MTQKDLAEEYATARLQGRLSGNEVSFSDNKVFTEEDIKAAFNAGRESGLENIPELDWETLKDESLRASTPFGCYNIDKNEYGFNDYIISFTSSETKTAFGKQNAKLAADEDYKKHIKQALGYD